MLFVLTMHFGVRLKKRLYSIVVYIYIYVYIYIFSLWYYTYKYTYSYAYLYLDYERSESVSCSVMSDSLWPHALQPTRLLCPWDSLGKNTGVDSQSFLQGIFWTRDRTWVSCIAGRYFFLPLSHQGSPKLWIHQFII